eukprot:PITA_15479
MEVKSAFLNGVLMEEVYIEQPLGYEKKGQEHKVCRLKKALYGLKQVPRAWYSRIDSYLLENGFDKCNDVCLIENFKAVMKEEFEMTDMGLLRYFLGIEVNQNENGIFISRAKYVNEVLGRFNMQECKAAITTTVMGLKLSKEDRSKDFDPSLYKSIVGSLMYLTATRPDIMFVVSLISRFMEKPKEAHWQATKRILRYVKDDQKSTSGYVFRWVQEPFNGLLRSSPL